ncbi:MAG: histidine kinase dimerization/phospho-acceptor domain-containing protein [Mariniphaga sp.]
MSDAENKLRIENEELRLRLSEAEEALRAQNLSNNIIENSPNALCVTDEHGTLIRMNQACRNLFRLQDIDVIGKYNILDNSYNEEIVLLPIIRDVYEKGFTARFVTSIDTASLKSIEPRQNIKVDVDVSLSPIFEPNGKVKNVVIQLIDISERVSADEFLKKSDDWYSSLVMNLNAGVVVHAPDTSIILSNPKASEFLGLTEEQMRGKQSFDPDWKFVNEDNIPLRVEEYPANLIVKTGHGLANLVIGVSRSKTKDPRWFLVNGIPVKDKNDEINEIIISFIDITERKLSELELFKAKEKAEQSDRLKTAFLANMSHEIRTPMNGILGFTSLLKESHLSSDEQEEYIHLIEKSGVRMLNIINDIIDISKIESGQMDLLISETDINDREKIYAILTKPEETAVQNSDSPNETINETKPAISGLKILIAEDDNDSSKYLELITKRFSKLVYRAATGIEAVEICQNNPDIDLVLMDIKMPVMDGYEATRQIRYFNSNVKIIAQTAYALHGDYEKALEAGCNDYTTKPINKDHLITLIQRHFLDMAS